MNQHGGWRPSSPAVLPGPAISRSPAGPGLLCSRIPSLEHLRTSTFSVEFQSHFAAQNMVQHYKGLICLLYMSAKLGINTKTHHPAPQSYFACNWKYCQELLTGSICACVGLTSEHWNIHIHLKKLQHSPSLHVSSPLFVITGNLFCASSLDLPRQGSWWFCFVSP